MKTEFYDQLKITLGNMMPSICAPSAVGLKEIRQELVLVQKLLDQLNSHVIRNGFINEADEIYFFKEVRPAFCAAKSFLISRYGIEANKPAGDGKQLKLYYKDELRMAKREMEQLKAYQQYDRSRSDEMDAYWFTKVANPAVLLTVGFIEEEGSCSTPGSRLFCRLQATELEISLKLTT